MKVFLLSFILFYVNHTFALEVDERLTLRFLRTSSSKKTVLINRGLEDGLAEGDHAKFFIDSGVIARGVVVKISPSRSVWSIYALVKPDEVILERIVNLKISTPVRLTQDNTKMISSNQSPGNSLVPLAPDAYDDPSVELSDNEKSELSAMEGAGEVVVNSGLFAKKDLEVWGLVHFTGLGSTSSLGDQVSNSGDSSSLDISLGFEKYLLNMNNWLNNVSIHGQFFNSSKNVQALEGSQSTISAREVGIGVNYHVFNPPSTFGKIIGHLTLTYGIGLVSDIITIKTLSSEETPKEFSGSSNFISVGFGTKYYAYNGFGFKMYLDYYQRGEFYVVENNDDDFTKNVSGPRFQVGLSYRW
jgi:hypothetical protein